VPRRAVVPWPGRDAALQRPSRGLRAPDAPVAAGLRITWTATRNETGVDVCEPLAHRL